MAKTCQKGGLLTCTISVGELKMKKLPAETRLCAVFVDYDNIYLSLRRQDELAAKQFPKSVIHWLRQLETGELITETSNSGAKIERRLVMCRCYGNPVPRRNSSDQSTDIGSFPFVRHHFLRAGFDIVDCPPLTSQLKNSSDIRMVMDIQDFLDHKTHFDEFMILSGDADFAPILQRLRTHARNTTIYVNENTAVPYVALCDAQVREQDLLNRMQKFAKQEASSNKKLERKNKNLLPEPDKTGLEISGANNTSTNASALSDIRTQITNEIERAVSNSSAPVALSFLADKAQRTIGHEKTVGSNWAGFGSFLNFLQNNLPETMRVTTNQPYYVVDESRHKAPRTTTEAPASETETVSQLTEHNYHTPPARDYYAEPDHGEIDQNTYSIPARQQEANRILENNQSIRDTISRVHEYTHVPALAPSEYQIMFEVITDELSEVGLKGRQTAYNISSRAKVEAVDLTPEDAQFVLDIISEADPWFEKGISPPLFAERFLNAIIARCRANGLHLTQEEFELVSAWFTGNTKSLAHHQNYAEPEQISHQSQETWLLPNSEHEAHMEPAKQLRNPYIDPLNPNHANHDHHESHEHMEKELPRMFRLGSDG